MVFQQFQQGILSFFVCQNKSHLMEKNNIFYEYKIILASNDVINYFFIIFVLKQTTNNFQATYLNLLLIKKKIILLQIIKTFLNQASQEESNRYKLHLFQNRSINLKHGLLKSRPWLTSFIIGEI